MTEFDERVKRRQNAGSHVKTTYGQKRDGTRFAFVLNAFTYRNFPWSYTAHFIIENSFADQREEFDYMDEADEYISRKKKELEG
uniref:DUF3276 family protein n=1 Tax=Panagrellus redivivus TaxID=6233 RepID=A0A7E4WCZ2_PANRE